MRSWSRRLPPFVAALVFLATMPLVHADYLEVLKDANVRERPDVHSKKIVRVPKGAFLPLKNWKRQNDYFLVTLPPGNEEGWIHYSVVRKKEGDPPESFRVEVPDQAESRELAWWARSTQDASAGTPAASPEPAPAAAPAPSVQREIEIRSQVEPLSVGNPRAFSERAGDGYAFVIDERTGLLSWGQYELTKESVEGAALLEERFFEGLPSDVLPVLESPGWNALAGAVKGWISQRPALTIILGPVYAPEENRVSYRVSESGHAVPTHVFKVLVFAPRGGEASALAFLFPNDASASPLVNRALVTVDDVEALTGLDLLSALPEDVQKRVEAEKNEALW